MSLRLTRIILFVLCLSGISNFSSSAAAQESSPVDLVNTTAIDKLKTQVESATDLTPEMAAKALEHLKSASDTLVVIEGLKSAQAREDTQLKNIDADQAAQKQKLDAAQALKPKSFDGQTFLKESKESLEGLEEKLTSLEQDLAAKQREVTDSQAALSKVEAEIEERASRLKTIKDRLAQIPVDLAKLDAEITALESSIDPQILKEARRLALQATRRQLQQESITLQSELSAKEARATAKILQTERQIHSLTLSVLKQEVESLSRVVTQNRGYIAEKRKSMSEELADQTQNELVKEVFTKNAKIVAEEQQIRTKQQSIKNQIDDVITERENLEEDWKQIQKRGSRAGSSKSFGIRLRQQRNLLPSSQSLRDENRAMIPTLEQVQLDYLEMREERHKLDDLQKLITEAKKSTNLDLDEEELIEQSKLTETAYEQQRDYLDNVIETYEDYIDSLDSLDAEKESLAQLSEEYAKYIDEKVLWIKSHEALTPALILNDVDSLQKLVDKGSWQRIFAFFKKDASNRPVIYTLAVLLWTVMLATHPFQKATLRACGKQASSRLNTSLTPTNRAILWTVLKSLVIPLPFLFLSWRAIDGNASPEILVFTRHLRTVAAGVLGFEFIRNVCRPFGLGSKHFNWPERANQLAANQISSFLALTAPVAVVVAILRSRSSDGDLDSTERICAVTIFLLAAYMLHRLTSKEYGIESEWVDSHPNSWFAQLATLFYLIAVAIPITLAVLTISGYTYASHQIAIRLGETFSLIFLTIFVRAYLMRCLTLGQRRRAIKQARELRARLDDSESRDSTVPEPASDRGNLAEIGEQTRRLLTSLLTLILVVGLWIIWSDILPALKYFDNWNMPGTNIAITSLFSAFLIGAIAISVARNFPGLLEVLLLERLPFDRSARYAIKAVTQYAIVLFSIILISQVLSIGWDEVQWLAAALTFGLGFGLQEIFANFVSGLIILFEQPVRVGDVVTIDNVSGVVNRIRIRSTTITDWDRKEYIVPNKEFITGRLLNWTLTDTINRVVIDVGVSYGSDVDKVRQILTQAALNNEHVLNDPPAIITFKGFGESSLDFTVRVFLPVIEKRLEVINDLHTTIYKALDQADIEIPFPQRDLHIRSITAMNNPQEILQELSGNNRTDTLE